MDRNRNGVGFSRALWALVALLAAPACTDVDAGAPPEPGRPTAEDSGFVRLPGAAKAAPGSSTQAAGASTPVAGEKAQVQTQVGAGDANEPGRGASPAAPALDGQPSALDPRAAPSGAGPAVELAASSEVALARAILHSSQQQLSGELERGATAASPKERLALAFVAALRGTRENAIESLKDLEKTKDLEAVDLDCLRAALDPTLAGGSAARALESDRPLSSAMGLALLEREGNRQLERGEFAQAAQSFSQLLQRALRHTWSEDRADLARWTQVLATAQAQHCWSPHGRWPSIEIQVQSGDHLIGIRKRVLAERPDLLLSTGLIARANHLRSENSLRLGETLKIPTERASALVDVSARWVLYLLGDEVACAFEVGVGKQAGSTRTGSYTIGDKREEPMWFAQGREPVPFGDPENPLGTRWMAWYQDGKATSLGFHGTNDEKGIGFMVSEGCIRMRNSDVELLFDILPKDAAVVVQP